MNELPGLAHMKRHVPPRHHALLEALVMTDASRAEISKALHIPSGAGFQNRYDVVLGALLADQARPSLSRLTLTRQAAGLCPCWCES